MTVIKATPKIVIKRTDVAYAVPTVPLTNDHTDGTWLSTDIYVGELFLNITDEKLYTRSDIGIVQLYPQDPGVVYETVLEYATLADFPSVSGSPAVYPSDGVIYIARDTNRSYRYNLATFAYVELSSAGTVYWASILSGPSSTVAQIDDAVTASHSVDAPNTSHYTIAESDGPAGNAGAKVDKVSGYDLSKNDFTDYYKALLDASMAEVQYYADLIAFPVTGEDSVLYAAKDTNLLYRWDGVSSPNAYVAFNEPYVADDEKLTLTNIAEPASPIAGNSVLWFDVTTGKLKRKTSAGTVYDIENANLNFWQAGSGTEGVTMINTAEPNINYGDNALAIGNGNLTIGNVSFVAGESNVIGLALNSLEYVDTNKTLTYYGIDVTAVWTVGKQVMVFASDRTVISAISTVLASAFDGTDTRLELAVALGSDYSNVTVISLDDPVDYSSVFGAYNTVASAYSVALGASGINSGLVSLTGGESCVASAYAAFSYGRSTVASGEFSVALGSESHAMGEGSIATGAVTYAIGSYSAAFGNACVAGWVGHAVSSQNLTLGYVIFDDVTLFDEFVSGYIIANNPYHQAIRLAYADVSLTNVPGKLSITIEPNVVVDYAADSYAPHSAKATVKFGNWSIALGGDQNQVYGASSVVTGIGNYCYSSNSIVAGNQNVVSSHSGASSGADMIGYHLVVGYSNEVNSINCLVTGEGNVINTCSTMAVFGIVNSVENEYGSLVMGYQNVVSDGQLNFVSGKANIVTDCECIHVEGIGNNVTGVDYAHVEGGENVLTAGADYSHAEGAGNTITGDTSHVEGLNNTVSGFSGAHGEGLSVTVTAPSAHAEGIGSSAYIQGMHASSSQSSPYLIKQYGRITNGVKTTDATRTEMAGTDTRMKLNDNTAYMFRIMCVGFSSTGLTCSYSAKGTVKRVGGTVTLDHSVVTEDFDGITVTGLELRVDDGVSKCLRLAVTGKVATKIEWNAVIEWSETGIAV